MKYIQILAIALVFIACNQENTKLEEKKAATPEIPIDKKGTFWDHTLDTEKRLDLVINELTLEEKCNQLLHDAPGIDRLGIKPYNWWNEALHGVARMGRATVFPQPIAMAATFDPELIEEVATAISDEGRAKFNIAQKNENYTQYAGLTYWSPNVNIFRDPRWGRGMETWGEDPFLTGKMGGAFVKGLQGNHPTYLKAAACAKHYAVHNGPEGDRHHFNAKPSRKDFEETYLPAFETLVKEANVEAVMCAYSRTYDEPCCGSTELLVDILRKKWGFTGHVMSDCGAITNFHKHHKVTKTPEESIAMALKTDVNLNCGSTYKKLQDAINAGLVTEADVNRNLKSLWRTRFKLGMFDPYGDNPFNALGEETVNSPEKVALARRAAQKSVVLLKNDGVLPLKTDIKNVFAIGPLAADVDVMLGNYNGQSGNVVTVIEGIASAISAGTRFEYRHGFQLDVANKNPIGWAIGEAQMAEVTIAVVGINTLLEGEEGEAIASDYKSDRPNIQLPGKQLHYLKKIKEGRGDKPLVVVVMGGSPIALEEVHELADAVVMAWYPGEQGGNAIADVIFGKVSPSGKLPVTFPKSIDQLPAYEDYSMNGRTYKYMDEAPQYPFGFGLSYGELSYAPIQLNKEVLGLDETLVAKTVLTNKSDWSINETVQLYVKTKEATFLVPKYDLKSFKQVTVKPNSNVEVTFELPVKAFKNYNDKGELVYVKGAYELFVGSTLPSKRSLELGAPKTVNTVFNIK